MDDPAKHDEFSDEETAKRRDDALRRMLKTPPKHRQDRGQRQQIDRRDERDEGNEAGRGSAAWRGEIADKSVALGIARP